MLESPKVFCKKSVFNNFAKFTGKHLCQNLFLYKNAQGLQLYLKSDSGTDVFCKFGKISKDTFSYRTPPVTASVSNTVKCVQAVRLPTLSKRDVSTGISEPRIFRSSAK